VKKNKKRIIYTTEKLTGSGA